MPGPLEEAEACIKNAEKHLKTSMLNLKFKPDFDSAAADYERAAVCYKNAGRPKDCLESYKKASKCHSDNGVPFHSAKCKEQASLVCRELGDLDSAKTLMEEACQVYVEAGVSETASSALEKAAKFFQGPSAGDAEHEKAVELYKRAHQIVSETDNTRQACEFLRRITKLYIRMKKYDEAVENIKKEIDIYKEIGEVSKIGQLACGLVIIQLDRKDSKMADAALQESLRISSNLREAPTLQSLINAYEQGDQKTFDSLRSSQYLSSLDNELLILLRDMKVLTEEEVEENEDDLR